MFRHTISSYSFWCSETYGLMKLFHLCSLVSIADKENGVGLVFFLHHSSSVSRDWEEETGPSFLRIPQVQGIWRKWICEGLSASFSAHSKNAPGVKRRKEKRKGGKKPHQNTRNCSGVTLPCCLHHYLNDQQWNCPGAKTMAWSSYALVQNRSVLSLLLVKLGICILISILGRLQSLLSLYWNTTFWNGRRDFKDF